MKNENTRRHKYHRGRRKKKKSKAGLIVLIIALIVFLVSGIMLIRILLKYKAGDDEYNQVKKIAMNNPTKKEDKKSYEKYWVDFDALSKENGDVVAWIRFDQPDVINYPVVQTDNNETYLTTSFQKNKSIYGTIFMEQQNLKDFSDANTILYGHNMRSGAMFGSLKKYNEESFYKKYPYFYIYTPDNKASKYQIASVRQVDADGNAYYMVFKDAVSYQSYIDEMMKKSYYDTKTEVVPDSKLVTLSTCTKDDDKRLVVQGVLVEQREMVKE